MALPNDPVCGIGSVFTALKNIRICIKTILSGKQTQLGSKHPKCWHRLAWTHGRKLSCESFFLLQHASPNDAQARCHMMIHCRVPKLRPSLAIWHYFPTWPANIRWWQRPNTRLAHELTAAQTRTDSASACVRACVNFWSHDLGPLPSLVPVSVDLRKRNDQLFKNWHWLCATPVLGKNQWKSAGMIWYWHPPCASNIVLWFCL